MAIFEQSIIVGSHKLVGAASVDGSTVRGDGGPTRPQLIVPLSIQMSPQPEEAPIAVVGLKAQLTLVQNGAFYRPACAPVTESLLGAFPARSLPGGGAKYTVQLKFFLSHAEVTELEASRHARGGDVFEMYLNLQPTVALLTVFNGQGTDGVLQPSAVDIGFGMYASVQPFWNAGVSDITVQIEQSTWVRAVLPGLGYDRIRLLELTFPPALPDHKSAASQFDKVRRAFDERRYGDCIQECRGLLNMWEKQYGAIRNNRIARTVATARGWPENDVRRDMLDQLWKEVGDMANAPHHPEGHVDAEIFDQRDARLILLLTTALSEYVEQGG